MTSITRILSITIASSAALVLTACADPVDKNKYDEPVDAPVVAPVDTGPGTLVEVAQGDETFSTLVKAVTAAKLGDTLSGDGPFTVFAPSDAAFGKIPDAKLTELTTSDTDTLATILQYHIVPGNVDIATLTKAVEDAGDEGYTIDTVGGGTLKATLVDGRVVLTDAAGGTATVTASDIPASNGMIHVIDTVLMPQ